MQEGWRYIVSVKMINGMTMTTTQTVDDGRKDDGEIWLMMFYLPMPETTYELLNACERGQQRKILLEATYPFLAKRRSYVPLNQSSRRAKQQ